MLFGESFIFFATAGFAISLLCSDPLRTCHVDIKLMSLTERMALTMEVVLLGRLIHSWLRCML